jgi:formylglycine-generating enzyme required for sulfatase activity
LSFKVSAADPDPGQTLELTATPLPAGATFTPSGRSGVFTWTPAPDQEGSYTITFQASDNGTPALSETKTVMITVTPRLVWMPLNFETATVSTDGVVRKIAGTPTRQYDEDLGGGVKLEMVEIPGGSFTMGSPTSEVGRTLISGASPEDPQRNVNIGRFVMGKYEVTQAQWRAVMGTNPSRSPGDNLPVEEVSWDDVKEFCRRLNDRLGLSGSTGYRLPSEAEWEYAARAGTTTPFAFGVTINAEIVNYYGLDPYPDGRVGAYRAVTTDVGSLGVANGWGLYDMHGNVQELCEDDWHDNYTGAPVNGNAWVETPRGEFRLLRGGGFNDGAVYCRSAYRGRVVTGFRNNDIGFRLARTLP